MGHPLERREEDVEGDVPDGAMPPGEMNPFIMLASGVGQLYCRTWSTGRSRALRAGGEPGAERALIQSSPCAQVWASSEFDRYGTAEAFPIVATTYRVSEHWQTGAMSRNMPWLAGLTPSAFVEIGTALAGAKGSRTATG